MTAAEPPVSTTTGERPGPTTAGELPVRSPKGAPPLHLTAVAPPVLQARGLALRYPAAPAPVFEAVDLDLARGEVVAVKQLKGVVDSHGYVEMEKLGDFVAELDMIARLRHPSIVRPWGGPAPPSGSPRPHTR